jgi:hypothetical protein
MLYVGAYQVRAVEHLRCPLLKHGCEAVADAAFARPFGIPDGFLAAGLASDSFVFNCLLTTILSRLLVWPAFGS